MLISNTQLQRALVKIGWQELANYSSKFKWQRTKLAKLPSKFEQQLRKNFDTKILC
jgi:hypothetical protein